MVMYASSLSLSLFDGRLTKQSRLTSFPFGHPTIILLGRFPELIKRQEGLECDWFYIGTIAITSDRALARARGDPRKNYSTCSIILIILAFSEVEDSHEAPLRVARSRVWRRRQVASSIDRRDESIGDFRAFRKYLCIRQYL